MELYHKESKEVISEQDFRNLFPFTSFPPQLSLTELAEHGYVPVLAAPPPSPNQLQVLVRDGVVTDSKGNIVQNWKLVPRFSSVQEETLFLAQSLYDAKVVKKAQVESARSAREKVGITFLFSDGTTGSIQTRSDTDIRNIQALVTSALVLKSIGQTGSIIPFRDGSDVIHIMTPEEVISMGMEVNAFVSETYQWAWDKKSHIDSCTTIQQLNSIEVP